MNLTKSIFCCSSAGNNSNWTKKNCNRRILKHESQNHTDTMANRIVRWNQQHPIFLSFKSLFIVNGCIVCSLFFHLPQNHAHFIKYMYRIFCHDPVQYYKKWHALRFNVPLTRIWWVKWFLFLSLSFSHLASFLFRFVSTRSN